MRDKRKLTKGALALLELRFAGEAVSRPADDLMVNVCRALFGHLAAIEDELAEYKKLVKL